MKLVGSEGDEHDDARVMAVASKVGEQVERRWVRPVCVLDHEQEARAARQPAEKVEDGFEQPGLPGIGAEAIAGEWLADVTKIGQQPRELWAGRAQELLISSGERPAASVRNASVSGPKGSPDPPSSTHAPTAGASRAGRQ